MKDIGVSGKMELYPHQEQILSKLWHIMQIRHCAMLTCDTGTGKTYIACALAQRLQNVHDLPCVIVSPAHLKEMWLETAARFSFKFQWFSYQSVSLGRLPSKAVDDEALWIFDEAHFLKNPHTKRFRNIQAWTPRAWRCFVTATPLSMAYRDVEAIAHLCGLPWYGEDPRVAHAFVGALSPNDAHSLKKIHAMPRFYHKIEYTPGPDAPLRRLLTLFGSMRFHAIDENGNLLDANILANILFHRLLSHRHACYETLARLRRYYRTARTSQNGMLLMTRQDYRKFMGIDGRQLLLPFEENFFAVSMPGNSKITETLPHLEEACAIMEDMLKTPDDKLWQIQNWILKMPQNRRIVLFSQYADTVLYFARGLRNCGPVASLTSSRARVGALIVSRDAIERAFLPDTPEQPRHPVRVLICSDAFACGHNFHGADILIHLDMPWNPTVIKQREGRVVRIGQKSNRIDVVVPETVHAPEMLKKYEDFIFRKLKTREEMIRTWREDMNDANVFKKILVMDAENYPRYWGFFRDRYIPVEAPERIEQKQNLIEIRTFSSAFAPNRQMARKNLLPLWRMLKNAPEIQTEYIQKFVRYSWIVALYPQEHLSKEPDSIDDLLKILDNIHRWPPIPIHAKCRIYSHD